MIDKTRVFVLAAAAATFFWMTGCAGSLVSSLTGAAPQSQTGTVNVMLSDDPTEDWATIGVRVQSIALNPQGGGTPVTVFTASSTPPIINLVQLDQLGEILGNATIPVGTYTSATVTLAANNNGTTCDVLLVVSGDPSSAFPLPAGSTVPCSQIVITGAQGTAPNTTVPLSINLVSPLTVASGSSNALDLEFDLRHPAFIVEHEPAGATTPTWAVNFNGPVRHHPRPDLTQLLLRHVYGQVASSTNTSITIERSFPDHPVTTPETATTLASDTLPIQIDSTNGTIFFDLDNMTAPTTLTSFSTVTADFANTPYVRIAARYQSDGTLVATRIYLSSSFDKIWKNPEGHVLHVNSTTNNMWVTTEDGNAKEIAIGPNTNFYFRASNNTVIGTGTAFFDGKTPGGLPNLARGFKVNVTIDPLSAATPPVALSVEIDVARYDGTILSSSTTNFEYNRDFAMADTRGGKDNYTGSIGYIQSTSANTTPAGVAVEGFYWWDFGFPTLPDTGASAVSDFVGATDGSVNFGGTVGTLQPVGLSNSTWNDPSASDTWSALWTVLMPVTAPLGNVSSAFSSTTNTFQYKVPLPATAPANTPAALPVTVDLMTASGSATLVYDVDRQGNVITITQEDISNSSTLTTVGNALVSGVPVKVFGVPQKDGSIKAYVLFYYTHTASTI
jgi:hypothetical protein